MKHVIYIYMLVCGLVFSSCNDYLDIVPKGNKIKFRLLLPIMKLCCVMSMLSDRLPSAMPFIC